jgi:N-acyl-D-aspartate/D-glutamate deacylase
VAHDVVIRGGNVVDGSGAEPRRADVAIDGETITAVGEIAEPGRQEIDAAGHAVTPGFVDIHTHLDAQIGWDPLLTPLSWHGVTTALLGNCGVTFAPCRPGDRGKLAAMMETVEDIPADAILNGLPWSWEDYGGYLDALQSLQPAINVAGLVGHCAVRFYVMGDRGVEEVPTEAELDAMADVVGQSIAAGAVGFSTSRFLGHYLPDGRHVPGTHAQHDELVRIAEGVAANGGGLMQNVLNLTGDFAGEIDLLRKQARATGDRVLFSIVAGAKDDSGERINKLVDELCDEGLDVSAVAIPRGSGLVTGLVHLMPFRGAAWRKLAVRDFEGRLASIDDPSVCAELVADAKTEEQRFSAENIFPLGEGSPDYSFRPEQSLQALADAAGESPAETYLRLTGESRGRALFTVRFFNPNLKAVAELISGKHVLPGLGDAGAHVGQVMDSGWCSFVLSHWVRSEGLFTVGEAVRRMTSAPARILGLADRGRIEPGLRADVNVIDLERVREQMPEYVHDFPGGAGRYIQRAVGYRATLCNGEVILENDEHTGTRSGQVIRG